MFFIWKCRIESTDMVIVLVRAVQPEENGGCVQSGVVHALPPSQYTCVPSLYTDLHLSRPSCSGIQK